MDGDSIIYGGLRGPRDLVPAFTRYARRQRDVTTWRSDNVGAEQLERAEKARYGGEIDRDTAARQRTSYATRPSPSTRDALARLRVPAAPMRSSVASYQIFHVSTLRGIHHVYILCTCNFLSPKKFNFSEKKNAFKV